MKKSLLIIALPLVQLAASSAFAAAHTATPAETKSRAEVKAETKAAATTPAGQTGAAGSSAALDSSKAASPVGDTQKNEAAAAQAVDQKQVSTKSRSEVKAEAKVANQKEVHKQKGDNLTTGK
ncbi:MAG: hypothetical protein V4695_07625 [Pseudomonadota bacterium]